MEKRLERKASLNMKHSIKTDDAKTTIVESSDQESVETQRNHSCVIDSQIPTCSKFTTGSNFDSSLDGHLKIVPNTSIKQKDHSEVRAVSTSSFLHKTEIIQEKHLPLTQMNLLFKCDTCDRAFKTKSGRSDHKHYCKNEKKKEKHTTSNKLEK